MKNKINEVTKYFKEKILTGEFGIKRIDSYNVTISVDNEYEFIFWTGNIYDFKESLQLHPNALSFMDLEFSEFEINVLYSYLLPIVNKYKKEVILAEKEAELIKLKNEIL